ncbi:hypothetical protein D477_006011 [Arthrobacter crystallopoietes BAB-32]|uniref:(2Fe-2S) ferredoxin domain-containing protein n=1 Tax=Arthrobacter crystallopoietes BAB-32 TaxID=1246476 RepID=N1UXJ2_9MICC|nr:hypothetical protein [Arthrobacter crystallopoietes]EMY35116.1 hypothetical protein D477_006011 [Arthrobacter crystallopoietes BAB-32]
MKRPAAQTAADPCGPALILCAGHRCSALLRRDPLADHEEQLRQAVRSTSGAVMISAGCVRACALAPVAAVARSSGTGRLGPAVWLAGIDDPQRSLGLQRWIRAGGPDDGSRPQKNLPPVLAGAVIAVAAPTSMVQSRR